MDSRISGFYKLSPAERLEKIAAAAELNDEEKNAITGGLPVEAADKMIENVIGTMPQPLGIAMNFVINGKGVLVPMATEEPSVVAAASNAAKITDSFETSSDEPIMIGQIQLVHGPDAEAAKQKILENKQSILQKANDCDPILVKFGGGARDVEVRVLDSQVGKQVIVHLLVDCRDAMGANAVNTMAETLAPVLEEMTGGQVRLRIISNLADKRLARAKAVWKKEVLGEGVADKIIEAYSLAEVDPYRCATHNKGIMNGIAAVVLATGNDHRAVEAGAHAYASVGGYHPLNKYYKNDAGDLVGEIALPMPVGLVGGATKTHPTARAAVKIMGVKTAKELAEIIVAVGLAQNFAALRALATVGIQSGHMKLHARNIAVIAGAEGAMVDKVAAKMVEEKKVRVDRAEEILKEMS